MRRLILLLLAVSVLSASLAAQELTILHTNDTHSHIEPERVGSRDGWGGVIEQAAYVDSVRCADGADNVLLLHAGDFSVGTSYYTQLNGNVEIDVLNAMGFDAVCPGNHEFDEGIDVFLRRLERLNVPVVCANYDFSKTALSERIKPYVILHKAGKKIGVIGLLTDLKGLVNASVSSQILYHHPASVADRYACELKSQGCDIVVCLTHLGYEGDFYTDVELASSVRNVDLIVGGHSHTSLNDLCVVKNPDGEDVVIVTNGKWGVSFGELKIK